MSAPTGLDLTRKRRRARPWTPRGICRSRPSGDRFPSEHRRKRYWQPSYPSRAAVATLSAVAVVLSALAAPATGAEVTSDYVAVVEQSDGHLTVRQFGASSSQRMANWLEDLREDGTVVTLDVDRPVRALGSVDPYRENQWALDEASFESSWPLTNGTGVVVAVLDTGVQADHEDLAGSVLTGWDTITNRSGAKSDANGHGTHVAGIIAAAAANGKGIVGAAPGVHILPVRVLDAKGFGRLADILEGIIWAADHGADVINLSLGGGGDDKTYAAVIRYALDKGAVVVAAAGNKAVEEPSYPAADGGAIAVTATSAFGTRASFSNYGSYVDLAAPGSAIYSTIPSGYASWSGTSMAAPYAAAAAALLAARYPDLRPTQIRDVLERSARDLGAPGRDDYFGAGLIDPAAALAIAAARPPALLPAPDPVPSAPSQPRGTDGYWVVAADGRVQRFGAAPVLGDASSMALAASIVAAAATPSGQGYWLAAADGAVLPFGDAAFHGSAQSLRLNAPIVGIAGAPSGRGYWLLGRDGGIFTFGDASFFGSTGGMTLNQPVADMAPTASGRGYWLVATDGGIFAFGDAGFHGSTGAIRLNRPVVSLTPSAAGGYWMVATDGGIFAFDVPFHGSLRGLAQDGLPDGRRIRATAGGAGYYILGSNGRVFPFGAATHRGSPATLAAVDLILAP